MQILASLKLIKWRQKLHILIANGVNPRDLALSWLGTVHWRDWVKVRLPKREISRISRLLQTTNLTGVIFDAIKTIHGALIIHDPIPCTVQCTLFLCKQRNERIIIRTLKWLNVSTIVVCCLIRGCLAPDLFVYRGIRCYKGWILH